MKGDVMRGIVATGVVVASVVTAGGFVASRYRGHQRPDSSPVAGIFGNGMSYVRWGSGPRKLLIIPGGVESMLPSGMLLSAYVKLASLLVAHGYTAWLTARKQHMPEGYGILDMAGDYAQLIADEFDGHVDTVVGVSYGGHMS
jgi:pimeloyl-ACP methyl ester carboxylesterase